MTVKKIIFVIATSLALSSEARVKHANILTWGGLNFGSFIFPNFLKCTYEHKFMFGGNIPTLIVGGRLFGVTMDQFINKCFIKEGFSSNLLTLKFGLEWTWGRTESGKWFGGDIAINGGVGIKDNLEFGSIKLYGIPCFISCDIFKYRSAGGLYLGIRLLTLDIARLIENIMVLNSQIQNYINGDEECKENTNFLCEVWEWLLIPTFFNLGVNLGMTSAHQGMVMM